MPEDGKCKPPVCCKRGPRRKHRLSSGDVEGRRLVIFIPRDLQIEAQHMAVMCVGQTRRVFSPVSSLVLG